MIKELPVSLRARKTQRMQQLYIELKNSGVAVQPTYLLETHLTIQDSQFKDRLIKISMDSLELVKVVVVYHQYTYDNTLEDRRNAIKTAKDIFEFYHDLRVSDYSRISKQLRALQVPLLSLYYQNISKSNSVQVTATARYDFTEFLFTAADKLLDINERLNAFTNIIATDMEGEGRELRWEKEIPIAKAWWNH